MEIVLSVVALASFLAMVGAWVAIPHPGQQVQVVEAKPESAPAFGLN